MAMPVVLEAPVCASSGSAEGRGAPGALLVAGAGAGAVDGVAVGAADGAAVGGTLVAGVGAADGTLLIAGIGAAEGVALGPEAAQAGTATAASAAVAAAVATARFRLGTVVLHGYGGAGSRPFIPHDAQVGGWLPPSVKFFRRGTEAGLLRRPSG